LIVVVIDTSTAGSAAAELNRRRRPTTRPFIAERPRQALANAARPAG